MSNVLAFRQPDTVRPEATGKGFALMHRQFMDSKLYKDSQAVHLWLHFIMKANHESKQVSTDIGDMVIGRGQFITGRPTLVTETGISDNKVKSLLDTFCRMGMITRESYGRNFTRITLVKYDKFQSIFNPTEIQQKSNAEPHPERLQETVNPTEIQRKSITKELTNNSITNVIESVSAVGKSEKQKPTHTCQDVVDAYHRLLPECPSVRALSDKRRNLIKTFWVKAGKITRQLDNAPFSMQAWEDYLKYISQSCRWMLGARPDAKTGKTWRCKNIDYLLSDEVYLKVREGNSDDV
ncbi:DNA replication protein [Yersinia frederiksenii]|nr:DNA replication protein [Yersinia frederiksenii]